MIYVFPGMGATQAMFAAPWRELPESVFLDWPSFQGENSLSDLAQRLIALHEIRPSDSVVGTSLGGIVGCEIANILGLQNLILIGSATQKEEINSLLALLHPLINYVPLDFVRIAAGKLPSELSQMFHASDPRFIRTMCQAIFRWEGLQSSITPFRIHGKRDRVIPPPARVDHLIDGGHLLPMTHAQECVDTIKTHLHQ